MINNADPVRRTSIRTNFVPFDRLNLKVATVVRHVSATIAIALVLSSALPTP